MGGHNKLRGPPAAPVASSLYHAPTGSTLTGPANSILCPVSLCSRSLVLGANQLLLERARAEKQALSSLVNPENAAGPVKRPLFCSAPLRTRCHCCFFSEPVHVLLVSLLAPLSSCSLSPGEPELSPFLLTLLTVVSPGIAYVLLTQPYDQVCTFCHSCNDRLAARVSAKPPLGALPLVSIL
jgi:hypothetical protein